MLNRAARTLLGHSLHDAAVHGLVRVGILPLVQELRVEVLGASVTVMAREDPSTAHERPIVAYVGGDSIISMIAVDEDEIEGLGAQQHRGLVRAPADRYDDIVETFGTHPIPEDRPDVALRRHVEQFRTDAAAPPVNADEGGTGPPCDTSENR